VRTIVIALAMTAAASAAQSPQTPAAPPAKPVKPVLQTSYEYTRKGMIDAAELMPEEGYAARASAAAKSFGEIVGHAVLTNFGVCAGGRKEENPKKGIDFEATVTAKAELVELLKASFAYCDPLFEKADGAPGSDALFLITHDQRMIGILESYLQTRGLALTSSEIAKPKKK
jgi:hypothetical protein